PGAAQLRSDLLLPGLRGVQPAGDQEQVLDRRLSGPGAQDAGRFPRLGLAAREGPVDITPAIARRAAVTGCIQHLDTVAGADVQNLGGSQRVAQRGKPRGDLRLRQRKAGDLIDARMTVGKPYHADLVHGSSRPRAGGPSVTERSRGNKGGRLSQTLG